MKVGSKSSVKYVDVVYKLRRLIRNIRLDRIDFPTSPYGNVVEFLTSFPRLRVIEDYQSKALCSFKDVLKIIDGLPNLKQIPVFDAEDDEQDFADKYMEDIWYTKRSELLPQKLSQLKKLSWKCDNSFKVNSLKFVIRYLTGLESVHFLSECNLHWTNEEQELTCNELMDILLATTEGYTNNLIVKLIPMRIMTTRLPAIIHKAFQQAPTTKEIKINRTIFIIVSHKAEFETM
jgi:hypothetical protein